MNSTGNAGDSTYICFYRFLIKMIRFGVLFDSHANNFQKSIFFLMFSMQKVMCYLSQCEIPGGIFRLIVRGQ